MEHTRQQETLHHQSFEAKEIIYLNNVIIQRWMARCSVSMLKVIFLDYFKIFS